MRSKYPAGWIRQRYTELWQRAYLLAQYDYDGAMHMLEGLSGNEWAAVAMGISDASTTKATGGQFRLYRRGKPPLEPQVETLRDEIKGLLR